MNLHIQKLYLDTSVYGGFYDDKFKEDTRILFEKIHLEQFEIIFSNITENELSGAPPGVRKVITDVPKHLITRIELTQEAVKLADAYINENVVGYTSRTDCFHIAMATIEKVDILVSWNFKHIVNVNRIRGYNSVNLRLGYAVIDIRSPKEIIYNED